jgi:hypothetical protein
MTMFGNSERDLCATLSTMESVARERTNFNTVEAKSVFRDWIKNDARFRDYDPDVLAGRVQECKSCGASLDLSDPRLKGGEKRPLERSNW